MNLEVVWSGDTWRQFPIVSAPVLAEPDKALGNSMAVPVMAWIGRRIQMVDEIE